MPLYSNILLSGREDKLGAESQPETATKRPIKETTSASMKLLQDHLMSKKRAKQASQQATKVLKSIDRSQHLVSESSLYKNSEFDWDLNDEYDPMMPNSYEILQLEYIKAEELKIQMARKSAGRKIDLSILDALEQLDDSDDTPVTSRGTAIAPPPTLHSTSSEPTLNNNPPTANSSKPQPSSEKLDGSSAAAKIMAKMGYKAGQGLGKDQQGISAPLEFEHSGSSIGRIVQRTITPPPPPPPLPITTLAVVTNNEDDELKTTRVLMLQNMVGPGEVDDELEAETKEECKKYGEVVKCLIYEIPNKRVPDDEAVRIFIEFKDVASSKRAANDLNGRYFGGRIVRASFYDQNKFDKYILAP